jgi:hypothetical protein
MPNMVLDIGNLTKSYLSQDFFSTRCVLAVLGADRYSEELAGLQVQLEDVDLADTRQVLSQGNVLFLEFPDGPNAMRDFAVKLKPIMPEIKFFGYCNGVEIGSEDYWTDATEEELSGIKLPTSVSIMRSQHGIPIVSVGGGCDELFFNVKYVLNARKQLKRALFIRKNVDLSNSLNMAVIPLSVYDIIIDISGPVPLNLNNQNIQVKMQRVVGISMAHAETVDVSERFDPTYLPTSVISGSEAQHNRNGAFFCSGLSTSKADVEVTGSIKQGRVNPGAQLKL